MTEINECKKERERGKKKSKKKIITGLCYEHFLDD